LISAAIGGRFDSWTVPSAAEIADVAEQIARETTGVPERPAADVPDTWPHGWPSWRATNRPAAARRGPPAGTGVPLDHLGVWREVRARVDWASAAGSVTGPLTTGRDGIAEHYERSRDFLAALEQVRAAVSRPLTFALLASWQRTVLGRSEQPSFRTRSAYAKGGRELYGWRPELPEWFEACLAQATSDDLPLPSRAARLYLDVAFFHPFDDGNSRAAALAVHHLLGREGVILHAAGPLLMTARRADDAAGAAACAKLIEILIDQTRRHARTG
jgi:hypothetical protein